MLAVAAFALRLYRLGDWSLSGDEFYTFYNSIGGSQSEDVLNVFPLSYWLTDLAILWTPEGYSQEFGLRIAHALVGALGVAFLPLVIRSFCGRAVTLTLMALLVFSPWLLYHAQFARYYAILFTFAGLAGFAYFRAVRERKLGWGIVCGVATLLAVAAHSTAAFLILAFALDALIFERVLRSRVARKVFLVTGIAALGVSVVFAVTNWPAIDRTLIYSLKLRRDGVDNPIDVLQGLVYNLGIHLALVLALTVPVALGRQTRLVSFLLVWAGAPAGVLLTLSALGIPTEQRYLIVTLPGLFWLSAIGVKELGSLVASKETWLARSLPIIMVVLFLPSIVSHFQDGNRYDYRGAAAFLRDRVGTRDFVVADWHALLARYAGWSQQRLLEAPPTAQADLSTEAIWNRVRAAPVLWVVIPDTHLRAPGNTWTGQFARWALTHCRVAAVFHQPRMDYHQNILWVLHRENGS